MTQSLESFKATLDEHHEWPCDYTFKFIVPGPALAELKSLLDKIPHSEKDSKTGKYTSVTVTITAKSSDEIITLYEKAATIEGIISL
ncbi:DUF493 domain-containing protein [Maridesulfovibrio hydrothermalis]|uniref:Uncharacterized protein n=1 Tax=Maridesulfovibrio hydrothermalis AM13 = DSM 14728 TaxID=1121451 RepID=L0REB0_9BACT|nr:DUF493 domain-containing protein [Maridesulfovibrio hydrothermalis]CCO24520.1 conserved protein of unknown function [Maridesulfovibrio hydrothermalis AM13 = DSM 14728]